MARREPRTRVRDVPEAWIGIGLCVCLAGVVFLGFAALAWADRGPYLEGVPCTATRITHCATDGTAVVIGTDVNRYRWDSYYVYLRTETSAEKVEIPEPGTVFPALEPGAGVAVRVWDHRVARIRLPGVGTIETQTSPLVRSVERTLYGVACLAWGVFTVAHGVAMGRGLRDSDLPGGALGRVTLASVSAAAASLPTMLLVIRFDVYEPATVAATFLGAALAVGTFAETRRRRRALSPSGQIP